MACWAHQRPPARNSTATGTHQKVVGYQELAGGRQFFGLFSGLHDVATRWVVTRDVAQWRDEIPWMSLYFSVAVWTSLLLGSFPLVRHLLARYRVRRPLLKASPRPAAIRLPSS